ncbi:MAG: tetratricopeptide repeat protein [bacterium]|nr:tetratricopeptide repeat protein [bacterium]
MARILQFPGYEDGPAASAAADTAQTDSGTVHEDNEVQRSSSAQRKPPKFGFTRVRRTRSSVAIDQLDLFVADTAASVSPESARMLAFPGATSSFESALADDESGNELAARAGYLAAIERRDCTSDAYCNLGILEYVAGNADSAFHCFRQALKHDQRHWESHYNLGNLYFDNGQHDPARVHYEVAAEIETDFRNVHFNLGLVLALEGEYAPAVAALERFRDLAPAEEAKAAEELLDTLRASQAHAEARRSPDRRPII